MAHEDMTKTESLVRVGIAYAAWIAVGAAWLYLGPGTGHLWLDGLIADLLATLVVFAASRLHGNSSFYDAYWSVLPPLLIGWWWSQSSGVDTARGILVMVVVVVWAIRLTGNWVYAFPGLHHEDWRYAKLRDGKPPLVAAVVDLMGIHVVPTIQVFLGCLPAYLAVTRTGHGLDLLDAAASVVGIGATVLEFAADQQMYAFVRDKQPGQAMDRGLWSWSRHPNYFGEWAFWVSLALFGLAASPGDWWWLFVGVVAMLAMFEGASIPLMEERSLERRPSYQDVIDRVPKFFPRPPRRHASRAAA